MKGIGSRKEAESLERYNKEGEEEEKTLMLGRVEGGRRRG